jgi:hypothetical protein
MGRRTLWTVTHPTKLLRIAAEAEGIHLRGIVTRIATHLTFAVIALLFVLGALALAHIAAFHWIVAGLGQSFV